MLRTLRTRLIPDQRWTSESSIIRLSRNSPVTSSGHERTLAYGLKSDVRVDEPIAAYDALESARKSSALPRVIGGTSRALLQSSPQLPIAAATSLRLCSRASVARLSNRCRGDLRRLTLENRQISVALHWCNREDQANRCPTDARIGCQPAAYISPVTRALMQP